MTMPEKPESIQPDEPIAEEVPPGDVDLVLEPADVPAAAPARRQLGVKEPIVFKWKLVGTSEDVILTLFKAVEREEVEAQLDRVRKDGYYTDLRILENDVKIVQPKPHKAKAARSPKRAAAGTPTAVTGKTAAAKAEAAKGAKPPPKDKAAAKTRAAGAKTRPAAAKTPPTATPKSTPKKTAPAKTASKRPAKKK